MYIEYSRRMLFLAFFLGGGGENVAANGTSVHCAMHVYNMFTVTIKVSFKMPCLHVHFGHSFSWLYLCEQP